MPDMNGLELKQELQRRNIPISIIFFTGNTDRLKSLYNLSNDAANFLENTLRAIRIDFSNTPSVRVESGNSY